MGSGASKETEGNTSTNEKVVCVDCDKSMQVDAPESSEAMNVCQDSYQAVDRCMKTHDGQVSSCTTEWTAFRTCHEQHKRKE